MRRALLAVVTALVLFPATAAAAPDTTIGFDGLAAGTVVTDQYLSASGVQFGNPEQFGAPAQTNECGAPTVAAAGFDGPAATIQCSSGPVEFPYRRFGTDIAFSTERRMVSLTLEQQTTNATQTATVEFYAIGGALLNSQTITLGQNVPVPVAYDHGASDGGIVNVVVTGDLGDQDSGPVLLDDIDATLDDVPPPKKFSLALVTPSVNVIEGTSVDTTIDVLRYNGSSGPVNLTLGALPSGILGAKFSSNPVAGSAPTTLTLTAGSPFTGQRQVSVTATGGASAGTAIGTSLVQTVTGQPAVTIPTGGRFPLHVTPGCGSQSFSDAFSVAGGYSGPVSVSITKPTGGLSASVSTPTVLAAGNGTDAIAYALTAPAGDASGTFDLTVAPSGATPSTLSLGYVTDRVSVASASPLTVGLPVTDNGSAISVVGNFPLGCPVTFKDGDGYTWPILKQSTTMVGEQQFDVDTLGLPRTAVSGPLKVVASVGGKDVVLAQTPPISVSEFRNVYALSQANGDPGGGAATAAFSWDDFEQVFGDDDVESCFIICVHDPVAVGEYHDYRDEVEAGGGLCYGYSVMAARFRGYGTDQRASAYQPGITRAWQITPTTDGTQVKHDVVRWFVAQHDRGTISDELDAYARAPGDELKLLESLINEQGAALIDIYQGSAAHSVVAYGMRPDPNVTDPGGHLISIYDSNLPYVSAEETNTALRTNDLSASTITLAANGSWSGTSLGWSGPNSTLGVESNIPPSDATLPEDFSISSLLGSSTGGTTGATPAAVTQISAGGHDLLKPGGVPAKGSGVTLEPALSGSRPEPEYQFVPGRSYALTIHGAANGSYDEGLIGDGSSATVTGADAAHGQVDHVTVQPGHAVLGFATGAKQSAVDYELVQQNGKVERTASIGVVAHRGASDSATLAAGALQIAHTGVGESASVTLGSVGEGLPGAVQLAPITLGPGQRLTLIPHSWASLGDGIRYTVRSSSGTLLRHGKAHLRAPKEIKLRRIAVHRHGNRLIVTGSVAKRGSSPLLAAVAQAVHGGKALKRHVVSRQGPKVHKGRFTLRLTLGHVPRGDRIHVTVVLLDQNAGLARVQRTATVR